MNVSKHLTQRIFLIIIAIYSVFLISFSIISFLQVYRNTKDDLIKETNLKIRLFEEHSNQLENYNNQITNTIRNQFSLNSVLSLQPVSEEIAPSIAPKIIEERAPRVEPRAFVFGEIDLNETQKYVINNMLENNQFFNDFKIYDITNESKDYTGEYTYDDLTVDKDILLNYTIYDEPIIVNQVNEQGTGLYGISFYENKYYLVYSFNEEVKNKINKVDYKDIHFYIQEQNNEVLVTNYHSLNSIQLISSKKDSGFSPLSDLTYLTYYQKYNLLNKDYIFVSQVSLTSIFLHTFSLSVIGLELSIMVLFLSLLLTRRTIVLSLKRPLAQFINELESFNEKDYVYFTSIQETDMGYKEFMTILNLFKKISFYHKNAYENVIQELKNSLILADESSKSKSMFLANMSHEMRTPLNSIIGYAQLIKKVGLENKGKIEEYFDNINNSSELLLQKINDILDLSKIESNQFELNAKPTEIKKLIKEIYRLLKVQADKKGINFTYYIDPQIPEYLELDKTRIKQVIINLCSNAIKFTDIGYVKLEVDLFGYTNDSVVLEYTISDSGCGIPKDKLDRIFIPFVQAENSTQIGTGLGLTIARDLIRLMGGDITVQSKENVGSIFTFTTLFKVSHEMNKLPNLQSEIDNDLFIKRIKNKSILIAEDNIINQVFIKELFAVFEKNDIEIVSNGEEAVQACLNKIYDLVLMDIQMPQMDGIEATKQIRKISSYNKIPIIALTANAFVEQINEYLKYGMTDYLPKPIDMKRFISVIMNNI